MHRRPYRGGLLLTIVRKRYALYRLRALHGRVLCRREGSNEGRSWNRSLQLRKGWNDDWDRTGSTVKYTILELGRRIREEGWKLPVYRHQK